MTPRTFRELNQTVEQFASKGVPDEGWHLNALEEGPSNHLTGYPFASPEAVGVHLTYTKENLTIGADLTSNPKSTWRDVLPSIMWSSTVGAVQHACLLRTAGASPRVEYRFLHPEFTFYSSTGVLDGFRSNISATTRLSAMDELGVSADYDPSRSGLVDATIAIARLGCKAVYGGDILLKYNATHGVGLHTRIPCNPYASAVTMAEKKWFIVGVEARSPCGAQMLMNVNLVDWQAKFVALRNLNDIWKFGVHYTAALKGGARPKIGVTFTAQDPPPQF